MEFLALEVDMKVENPLHGYYEVIYADPPWSETGGGRIRRGADRHYPLMTSGEIQDLGSNVRFWAKDDSMLFLWATNNFLADAIATVEYWGFRYVTNLVWVKDRFGLGFYFRGQHEICLFGIRGKPPHSRQGKSRAGRFIPPSIIQVPRREHSQKPIEVYDIIEGFSTGPYLEMFARTQRAGWDCWGNEVDDSPLILPT